MTLPWYQEHSLIIGVGDTGFSFSTAERVPDLAIRVTGAPPGTDEVRLKQVEINGIKKLSREMLLPWSPRIVGCDLEKGDVLTITVCARSPHHTITVSYASAEQALKEGWALCALKEGWAL